MRDDNIPELSSAALAFDERGERLGEADPHGLVTLSEGVS